MFTVINSAVVKVEADKNLPVEIVNSEPIDVNVQFPNSLSVKNELDENDEKIPLETITNSSVEVIQSDPSQLNATIKNDVLDAVVNGNNLRTQVEFGYLNECEQIQTIQNPVAVKNSTIPGDTLNVTQPFASLFNATVEQASAVEVIQPTSSDLNATVTQSEPVEIIQSNGGNLNANVLVTGGTISNLIDVTSVNQNLDVRQLNPSLLNATVTQENAIDVVQSDPSQLQVTVDSVNNVVEVISPDPANFQSEVYIAPNQQLEEINQVNIVTSVGSLGTVGNVGNVGNVDSIVQDVKVINGSSPFNVNVADGNLSFVPDPYYILMQNQYPNLEPIQVYCRASNVTNINNWATMVPDSENSKLPLIPTPGIQLAISADFDGGPLDTTTQIVIEYYANDFDSFTSTTIVQLNGNTKVSIPGTIYRIKNFYVNPITVPTSEAEVYFYDATLDPDSNGVPNSYFDYLRIAPDNENFANTRETGIYYCPPGKVANANGWSCCTTNDNNDVRGVGFKLISPSGVYLFRQFYLGNGFQQYNRPQIQIPGGFTVMIMCKEILGSASDIQFNLDLVERFGF